MKKYVTDINNKLYFQEDYVHSINTYDEQIKLYKSKSISFFSGMGGALTQASCYNYNKLTSYSKNKFINLYFKDLKYKYIRLPIGSCDFAPYTYSYLKGFKFNIEEDIKNIHPLLNDIKEYQISYLASPWSPPTRWKLPLINRLRRTCYRRYAKYLINYLKFYKEYGINIDFISIQNEPRAYQKWESCVWSYKGQKNFIYNYLIPLLKKNKLKTSIMLHDHNKDDMLKAVENIYTKDKYVGAVAFHWYTGSYFDELNKVHQKYPNLLLIESEMSCGFTPYDEKEWINDAELYANEIIGNINNGMNIFVDWNLLLDENGGPNHKNNFVKSPIIRDDDQIVLTPIYHYLKHISLHQEQLVHQVIYDKLKVLATKKDDKYIITVLNNTNDDINFNMKDMVKDTINKHTIVTYII